MPGECGEKKLRDEMGTAASTAALLTTLPLIILGHAQKVVLQQLLIVLRLVMLVTMKKVHYL
jgi:cyanate permease